MRRLLYLSLTFCIYLLLWQCSSTYASPTCQETTYGDVNDDGKIGVTDIYCALEGVRQHFYCGPIAYYDVYPCEGDGVVNQDDYNSIVLAFGGAAQCPNACNQCTEASVPIAIPFIAETQVFHGETVLIDGIESTPGGGFITSWDWLLSDGTMTSGPLFQHQFLSNGPQSISLTVTNSCGVTDTQTLFLNVVPRVACPNARPTPYAPYDFTTHAGEEVILDASFSTDPDGEVLSYQWTLAEGSPPQPWQSSPIIRHVYQLPGVYTASLQVKDDCGTTSPITHVTITVLHAQSCGVNRFPFAFAGPAKAARAGQMVEFLSTHSYDEDGEIQQYHWDFGDGNVRSGQTVQHAYLNPGTYTATLTVTDACGESASDTTTVNIEPATEELCGNQILDSNEQCEATTFPALDHRECRNPPSTCNYQSQVVRYYDSFGKCQGDCRCMPDSPSYSQPSDATYCGLCSDHCGDGVINCAEVCEPGTSRSCGTNGIQFCKSTCDGWTECATSSNACGNGVANGTEQCDCGPTATCTSSQLRGATCQSSPNYTGGALSCFPPGDGRACKYDRSECVQSSWCSGNVAPEPIHTAQITGFVGEPILFDGSASNDPDGRLAEYIWMGFGDDPYYDVNYPDNPSIYVPFEDMEVRQSSPFFYLTYQSSGVDHLSFWVKDNCGRNADQVVNITVNITERCGDGRLAENELCESGDLRPCTLANGSSGVQSCLSGCNGWNACQAFSCPAGHQNNGSGTCSVNIVAHKADGYGWTKAALGIPWADLLLTSVVKKDGADHEGFVDTSPEFVVSNFARQGYIGAHGSKLSRYVMSFDTRSVPDQATIFSSSISLTSVGPAINSHPESEDFVSIFQAELRDAPSARSRITDPPYYLFSFGENSKEVTSHRLDVSTSYLPQQSYSFPLNREGKTSIEKQGFSSFSIQGGYDRTGEVDSNQDTEFEVGFKSADAASGQPVLRLTYGFNANMVICGNDRKEGAEACDGEDLAGKTCTNLGQGFIGGELLCSSSCSLDTSRCFQQFNTCLPQGTRIPSGANRPPCCPGLSVLAPRSSSDTAVNGYCSGSCGNGYCEVNIESRTNCPVDCNIHQNTKDMTRYTGKPTFLATDLDWKTILSYVPVAVWTEQASIKSYPFLIAHQDNYDYANKSLPMTSAPQDQSSPVTNGDAVVWVDYRNNNFDLTMCRLSRNGQSGGCRTNDQKVLITDDAPLQDSPLIDGNRIVWRESTYNPTFRSELVSCDLTLAANQPGGCSAQSTKRRIGKNPAELSAFSGNYIVWAEVSPPNQPMWYYCDLNLAQGQSGACYPNDPARVLSQFEYGRTSLDGSNLSFVREKQIGLCNILTPPGSRGACTPSDWITVSEYDGAYWAYSRPVLKGNSLLWFYYSKLYRYDLTTEETLELPLTTARAVSRDVAFDGSTLVWLQDHSFSQTSYLWKYDLNSHSAQPVTLTSTNKYFVNIHNGLIVWSEQVASVAQIFSNTGSSSMTHLGGIDLDSSVHFLQLYQPTLVSLIGSMPGTVNSVLTAATPTGAGLSPQALRSIGSGDSLTFWSSYQSVVYVDDSYELALPASTYASLINAPLVIKGTSRDVSPTYAGKQVVCIGQTTPTGGACARRYNKLELEQRYLKETGTDKLILVNRDDLLFTKNPAFTVLQPTRPDKTNDVVHETFAGISLSAPILASAKHQLLTSTTLRRWEDIDALIEAIAYQKFGGVLRYLTLVGPSVGIPKEKRIAASSIGQDDTGTMISYGDINGDACLDLGTGFISGITSGDAAALVARTLFLSDLRADNSGLFLDLGSEDISPWLQPIQNELSDWTIASEVSDTDEDSNRYPTSELIYWSSDAEAFGLPGVMTNTNLDHANIYLSTPILSVNGCNTCGSGDDADRFCFQNVKRGAVIYAGAVEVGGALVWHDRWFTHFYDKGLSVGDAFKRDRNKKFLLEYDDINNPESPVYHRTYTNCEGSIAGGPDVVLGDPTLTFADLGYERACDGVSGPCCGNGIIDSPSEQCDGADLGGRSCLTEGYRDGYLLCSPTCTLQTTQCLITDCSINQLPLAIAQGPTTARVGIPVTFDGSASSDPDGVITDYWWSYGNNTTSGLQDESTTTYTYPSQGTFTVKLMVKDNCNRNSPWSNEITLSVGP